MQTRPPAISSHKSAVLLGCALASLVSAAPVIATTVSLFIVPVSQEFGWDRSQFPLAIMAAAWVGGLCAPLAGRVIDRLGAKTVMLFGIAVFALANVLLAFADGSRLQTYALYMLLGSSSSFSGTIGVTKIISGLFQEGRGKALGVSLGIGVGLGSALTPLLTEFFIHNYGWRAAYVALGAMVFLVAFPAVLFLAPAHTPSPMMASQGNANLPDGLSVGQAARTREFWLLALLIISNGFAAGSISGHWVPMQTERGVAIGLATALLSAFGIVKIAAQIGGGVLLDRIQSPRLALLILVPVLTAAAAFAFGSGPPSIVVAALLFGLGEGAELGLIPYLLGRYFGLRRFGEIAGWMAAASIISAGLGNVGMGRLFDLTGDYQFGLYCAVGYAALAMAAAAGLGPYRYAIMLGAKPDGTVPARPAVAAPFER